MKSGADAKRHSQFTLLRERRFAPFFGVQFLGAFNDNVFKQALVIMLAYNDGELHRRCRPTSLQNVAQALFILPFLLFSATAGQIADKYEKSRLITLTVALELVVMMIGAVGFFAHSLPLLLAALFLGGVQSTLFGPVKYAILPQQLAPHELVGGNALVESGTSLAVLLGMIYGGWLIARATGASPPSPRAHARSRPWRSRSRGRYRPRPPPIRQLRIRWNPATETMPQSRCS